MLAGVSGVPETIHSAPEVNTCRCPPEKTPRMAFTWSETRPNSMAWSSRPAPRSKLNRSPVRDIHRRFGRSREPPTTKRSWWKQRHTGQPRAQEKADSSQSRVGAAEASGASSTVAVACVGEATAVTINRLPPMRKRVPVAWPARNSGSDAVSVTVPVVPLGVSAALGRKRWKGSRTKAQGWTVQLAWPVRVMRCGAISGWQRSRVSALWVWASCGSIAAAQRPGTRATSASPMKMRISPAVSASR